MSASTRPLHVYHMAAFVRSHACRSHEPLLPLAMWPNAKGWMDFYNTWQDFVGWFRITFLTEIMGIYGYAHVADSFKPRTPHSQHLPFSFIASFLLFFDPFACVLCWKIFILKWSTHFCLFFLSTVVGRKEASHCDSYFILLLGFNKVRI